MTKIDMSISQGNKKVGKIDSFSLPPVESCVNSKTCAVFTDENGKKHKCYAVQPYVMYKSVKAAYDRNFELVKEDLPELKKQLMKYFRRYNRRLFRIHVSGDFPNMEYVQMWIDVAKANPHVKFMAFTKAYGFFYKTELPENLVVLFSFMPSVPYERARKFADKMGGFPIAYASNEKAPGTITCPEQTTDRKVTCETCQLCWKLSELKRPVDIHFIPH